ncbi:MAG: hypothetical protein EZS28_034369 [Streblomastix strix]|uniref:Uncharacterized protein n=1 Tax=Streblomastix strix TaxID=222440 RepID=A0A5J4UIU2_9EUKA|nr:MAG: hypothetical protein EZS28_034369 [Streblomastix strix]
MPINAQPNRYHECPSCGNVFHYRIVLNHASQCPQDQKNRLVFNFAQEILPQMEFNTGRGYFQAKQGFITKCPLCEQVPKDNINTHVHMLHKDVEQLFQKCLHFHDEMQLP